MKWQQEAVERLVSPLPLREREKECLREELWGHLISLYDEELAQGAGDLAAREAACNRLGSPPDLADAFDRDRTLLARVEQFSVRHTRLPGSSVTVPTRNLARTVARMCGFLLCMTLATTGLPGMALASALITWITISMLLLLATATLVLARCAASGLHGEWCTTAGRMAFAVAVGCRVIPGVVVFLRIALATWVAGYVLTLLTGVCLDRRNLLYVFDMFSQEVFLRASLIALLLGPAMGWAVVWREWNARKLPGWPYSHASMGDG